MIRPDRMAVNMIPRISGSSRRPALVALRPVTTWRNSGR
jgi:hypothetical protein